MKKRWIIKEQGNEEAIQYLMETLNIDPIIANLLVQRKIYTFEDARRFFRPSLHHLHDPFLMIDIEKAIDRIEKAILNKEKILIYGDYDVDGTTAVALVYSFFKKFYGQIDFYIPDRYSEGYGISYTGIDFAYENDFKLVITLDCGIKATDQVAYAKEKGIDFIIGDHHRPGDTLPDAVAILDPKRSDSTYPYDELSGCGIGFKLIQAFAQHNNIPFEKVSCYLDLVAISIASDIVPITGENRILAYYGLKLLNSKPRPGIEAILKYSNVNKQDSTISQNSGVKNFFNRELTINDLVFLVGPRINASGRIETGKNSVELLLCTDPEKAFTIGTQINNYNSERKNLDSQVFEEAVQIVENDSNWANNKCTVVFNEPWHKGVLGIVASRLVEKYYKPTVVLALSNGLITGSARSVKELDIYDAIDSCSHLLEHFGGHKYAAGLSMKPENFEKFKELFEQKVNSTLANTELIPEIEIDSKISLKDITPKFLRLLKQFAPFGPENMAPIFLTDKLIDNGYSRLVGNNHLKLSVTQKESSSNSLQGIAFQQGDHTELISAGNHFSACFHVEENEWNGKINIQLNVKDIIFDEQELA